VTLDPETPMLVHHASVGPGSGTGDCSSTVSTDVLGLAQSVSILLIFP